MEAFRNDVKYALRTLRQSPGFTITAMAALTLGISANTAIFTVVDAVILRPLPFANAGRIVNLARRGGSNASIPMFQYWKENNPGFEDLAASLPGTNLNLNGGDRPETISTVRVSANYFRLLGANPMLGRTFTPGEDRPGGDRSLVMSYGLWARRFGRDPAILGRNLTLGGVPYRVVGVLPRGFIPYPAAEAWIPLQADPHSTDAAHVLQVWARLPPGLTLTEANTRMATVGRRYEQALAPRMIVGTDSQIGVTPIQEQLTGNVRPSLLILLGAVGMVLLMACANVANLLMARATARQREIAIRAAMGAGPGRLVRQLLTESAVLALAAGALGMLLGSWSLRALLHLTPGDLPRAQELALHPALDPRVAGFTVLLAALTGALFGLIPAWHVSRIDLASALKESGGRSGGGLKHRRTRSVLVSAEVLIAVVLLCGALLLIRSFAAMHAASLGYDPHDLLTMEVSLAGSDYGKSSAVERIGRQFGEAARRIPGVESAALASALPLFGGQDMLFGIPGRAPVDGHIFRGDVQWRIVSADYFQVLRIPLVAGRYLRDSDAGRTVVISQALARQYWSNENPVGQSLVVGSGLGPGFESAALEVVGVAGDVRERMDLEPSAVLYETAAGVRDGAMALVNRLTPAAILIRTRPGIAPMSLSQSVQQVLLATDQLPAVHVRTMEQVSRDSTARQDFNLLLLGLFAAIALLLAAVGIYGVMSYSVAQRTHEIGIRTALGANRRDTLRLILGQALRMTAFGVGGGLLASFWLTELLTAQLFHVKHSDAATYAAVPAILIAVALAAAYIPALRATRVDPLTALRDE